MIAIDVRTPSSASLEYAKLKVEKAAELARTMPETKATNSNVNAGGGRVYVDIGKSTSASARRCEIAAGPARATDAPGRRRIRGARRPQQRRAQARADPVLRARTRAACMAITNDFMEKMKKIPGAVDVGLSEQEPEGRAEDRARPRARQPARHLGRRRGAGAARGVRRRRGRRLGRSRPASRATWRCACIPTTASMPRNIEHLPVAVGGSNMMVPLDQIATITHGQGPGADPAPGRQAHDRRVGQRAGPLARAR